MDTLLEAAGRSRLDLPIASHVELLLVLVLLHTLKDAPLTHTHSLHQGCQILQIEVPVRTAVRFARSRWVFRQNLLAAEWTVTIATPIRIPANVTIGVSHIVPVILVELFIRNLVE